jgi:hypothetical protein
MLTSLAFADLMIDGHRETWLRSWLRRKYYEATGGARHALAWRNGVAPKKRFGAISSWHGRTFSVP